MSEEASKLKITKPTTGGSYEISVAFGKDPEDAAEKAKGVGIYSNPIHCANLAA